MSDFTVKMKYPCEFTSQLREYVTNALNSLGLYEGVDYELIVHTPTDPLAVEPVGDEASGKQLWYMRKLNTDVRKKFHIGQETLSIYERAQCLWAFDAIDEELRDGDPNRRRCSAIIDALKDVEGML